MGLQARMRFCPVYNVVWAISGQPVESVRGIPFVLSTGFAASFHDVEFAIDLHMGWHVGSCCIVYPERCNGCYYVSAATIGSAYPLSLGIVRIPDVD